MTHKAFQDGYVFLCATFGKEVSVAQAKAWEEIVGQYFSDAEWAQVVRHIAETERFFPTPAVFLEQRKRTETLDAKLQAELVFNKIEHRRNVHGGWDENDAMRLGGERGLYAFRAVGGSAALQYGRDTDNRMVRKDFVESWLAWEPDMETWHVIGPSKSEAKRVLEMVDAKTGISLRDVVKSIKKR